MRFDPGGRCRPRSQSATTCVAVARETRWPSMRWWPNLAELDQRLRSPLRRARAAPVSTTAIGLAIAVDGGGAADLQLTPTSSAACRALGARASSVLDRPTHPAARGMKAPTPTTLMTISVEREHRRRIISRAMIGRPLADGNASRRRRRHEDDDRMRTGSSPERQSTSRRTEASRSRRRCRASR